VHDSRDAAVLAEAVRVYAELWRGIETGALTIDAGVIARIEKNVTETTHMVEEEEAALIKVRAGDRGYMHVGSSIEETVGATLKQLVDLGVEVQGCDTILQRAGSTER
jgi:hypothetical protein